MSALLEMKDISKHFPGVIANNKVNLTVDAGEVHTLLGENGAGKSTLMNCLCGLYKPTSGEIYIDGKQVSFSSAKDAMAIGIGMVHQHFMLIPSISVVENCLIGDKTAGGMKLDIKTASDKITALGRQYNMQINPHALVGDLSVGQRQRVEIIKALFRGARILILDEPTAVLTPQETGELFKMIRGLTSNGFTVLFISHKLNEVKEISDRVTVLRLGQTMGTYDTADCSVEDLARLMVGRKVDFAVERANCSEGDVVVSVRDLKLERPGAADTYILNGLSFDVHANQIVGVAGVDGNGQSELVECLTGLMKATSGTAIFAGRDLLQSNTRQIMSSGVSHVPQDRQKTGLVMQMNLNENFMLQDYYQPQFGKGALMDWRAADEYSDRLIREYGIKTPGRYELAQNLSGGNQQKVVVAREISRSPKFLIAMHPTRGLDVGAIEYIHKQIMNERDNGVAILLVSTELDEVLKLSDVICVMYEGRIMGVVAPAETTVEEMGLMMGGTELSAIRAAAPANKTHT